MTVAFPETPLLFAVMVAVPAPTAVTVPVASTVATEVLLLVHAAVEVTSEVEPPTETEVAVICLVSLVPLLLLLDSTSAVVDRVMWSAALGQTKKSPQPL